MTRKMGDRTVPCWTPLNIGITSEMVDPNLTTAVRLLYHALMSLHNLPFTPALKSECRSIACSIKSKSSLGHIEIQKGAKNFNAKSGLVLSWYCCSTVAILVRYWYGAVRNCWQSGLLMTNRRGFRRLSASCTHCMPSCLDRTN